VADIRIEIVDEAGAADWTPLVRELDAWSAAGRIATFWLRDDDAVDWTPQLARLFEVAGEVPVALAVIPALAEHGLAKRLRNLRGVEVLQHGWRHDNHWAPHGLSEYPAGRDDEEVGREFRAGRDRLKQLFGDRALPVFAPPYHGFDDRFLPALAQCGIRAISRKGPRSAKRIAAVAQSNIHVVLIDWTEPPSFGDPRPLLESVVEHLRGRRLGRVDSDEPTGLLTHHLVQDEASYDFLARLIEVTAAHPAARWLRASEVFAEAATG
jgi:peptidoglycan/xylan/chitin deacetylase (PgdA/CDA1 family)